MEIKGVGGSYANGKPRVGLFPKSMTYADARNLEGQKRHEPGGVLIYHSGVPYPSDVDLEITFKPADNREAVTLGDTVVMSRRIHDAMAKVFDQTRVLISAEDQFSIETKPLAEVRERLKTL